MSAILPLVYAEDVSSNGTTVIRQASDPSKLQHMKLRISRRDNQHSVLLSHGDEIYLTPNIWLAFEQRKGIPDDKLETLSIDSVRQCEQQVYYQILAFAHIPYIHTYSTKAFQRPVPCDFKAYRCRWAWKSLHSHPQKLTATTSL